ncbi:Immunity protein 49 [Streptomyces sp. Ag82_O1-12]|uniref:immunity 49 family protein n=1 Tax=unclassified Streptomyces TaxID=2593676 RepID=UPI000BD34365|nr:MULTISPECIES: immunity 49 family protein [unclassified Streptomyces]SMQ18673.1 Immunity protein 49 [Streptomyces sp. Ag82_O1-12]SOD47712.1 Immunity protein 49 [Streptomyces sp. Ag82_G6-1]
MVSVITRHPFPTGNAEEGLAVLQENAQELLEGLEADPTGLGDALSTTLNLAEAHCLMDPRAAIYPTWDAWVTAMQVGSAVFAGAMATEGNVHCRIAHRDLTLQATGPQWYVHPGAWLTAFYLAVACREKDRITALCRVPLSLLRENGAQFEEHDYAWIDTLQTYWLGGQELVPKLVSAVDGTDPETVSDPETVGKLVYPPMEMFHRFIRKDHEGFNRALAQALELHKQYWSEEDRAVNIAGLVALAPLAMVCLAHDAGMPIEVESDYLPAVLIGRNWCGEFPT